MLSYMLGLEAHMSTPVKREQFKISDEGIEHLPTGYRFTPHPGSYDSGTVGYGQHGNRLASGEDYRPMDVEKMARGLWAEHVEKKKK